MKDSLRKTVDIISDDWDSDDKTTLFFIGLLAWTTWLVITASEWGHTDRLFPLMIGVPLIVLLVIYIIELQTNIFDVVSADENPENELAERLQEVRSSTRSESDQLTYELIMVLWVVSLPLLIYYLGFLISIPLYIFAFCIYFIQDVKIASMVTVTFSVSLFVLFAVILDVSLWEGVVFRTFF